MPNRDARAGEGAVRSAEELQRMRGRGGRQPLRLVRRRRRRLDMRCAVRPPFMESKITRRTMREHLSEVCASRAGLVGILVEVAGLGIPMQTIERRMRFSLSLLHRTPV